MSSHSAGDPRPGCPDCGNSLWHCHEVLILHESHELECVSGAACARRIDIHTVVVSCRELQPPCGC
ncbi:MAG: hypothetical protein ACRD21_25205 [Vicinamibacteria bacterium]